MQENASSIQGETDGTVNILSSLTGEQLLSLPNVNSLVNKLVSVKVGEKRTANNRDNNNSGRKTSKSNNFNYQFGESNQNPNREGQGCKPPQLVKSPSDTTLYMPALRRISQNEEVTQVPMHNNDEFAQKISDFVENIRLQQSTEASTSTARKNLSREFHNMKNQAAVEQEEPTSHQLMDDQYERDRLICEVRE